MEAVVESDGEEIPANSSPSSRTIDVASDMAGSIISSDSAKLIVSAFAKTFSAGIYIFDFVSNIFIAKSYYELNYKEPPHYFYQIPYIFIAIVVLMVVGHICSAITFLIELPREDQPVWSAYFLPLLQLYRLMQGVYDIGSTGIRRWRGKPPGPRRTGYVSRCNCRVEELYAIMAASVEAATMFLLQFLILVLYGTFGQSANHNKGKDPGIPLLCVLSLTSSALSVFFNTGRAIMFQHSLQWGATLSLFGAAGGLVSLSALLLRSVTVASVAEASRGQVLPIIYSIGALLVPFILLCKILQLSEENAEEKPKRTIVSLLVKISRPFVATYSTLAMGPLYSLVKDASRKKELKVARFRNRLVFMVAFQIIWEVIFLITVASSGASPCTSTSKNAKKTLYFPCSLFATMASGAFAIEILSVIPFVLLLKRISVNDTKDCACFTSKRSARVAPENIVDSPDTVVTSSELRTDSRRRVPPVCTDSHGPGGASVVIR